MVRRASAILLVAVCSLSLIGPAFTDANSALPSCCRRDGRHHCAMTGKAGVQLTRQKCSNYPEAGAAPACFKTLAAKPSHTLYAAILTYPAGHAQTEARYGASFNRSRQKRGPPTLL
jgi:hypothetical protein